MRGKFGYCITDDHDKCPADTGDGHPCKCNCHEGGNE